MLDRNNDTNIGLSPNSCNRMPGRNYRPGYFFYPDPVDPGKKSIFSDTSFNKLGQLSPLSSVTVKPVKINQLRKKSSYRVKKHNARDQHCRPCKIKVINWVYTETYPYKKPVGGRGKLVLVAAKRYRQLFSVASLPDLTANFVGQDEQTRLVNELKYLSSITPGKNESTHDDIKHSHAVLLKKAKAKYISEPLASALSKIESPLQNSYIKSIDCCSNLVQQGDKITGKYCKQRWCMVCNRIRTAQLINGYSPVLDGFDDPYFVTLTVPNMPAEYLEELIEEMQKAWRTIYKKMKRNKLAKHYGYLIENSDGKKADLRGLKKIECTYNFKRNDYHPHYHFIINGEVQAHLLKWEWFKHWGNLGVKLSNDAQDVRPVADKQAYLELFKYFTKIIVKDAPNLVYTNALDNIFKAMYEKRTFEPVGIKKVSEEIKELNTETYEHLKHENRFWNWLEKDWFSEGEQLTGFIPGEIAKVVAAMKK